MRDEKYGNSRAQVDDFRLICGPSRTTDTIYFIANRQNHHDPNHRNGCHGHCLFENSGRLEEKVVSMLNGFACILEAIPAENPFYKGTIELDPCGMCSEYLALWLERQIGSLRTSVRLCVICYLA